MGIKEKDVGEFLSMGHSLSEIIELELPPIYVKHTQKQKNISNQKSHWVLNDFEISEEYRTHDRVYIDSIRSLQCLRSIKYEETITIRYL